MSWRSGIRSESQGAVQVFYHEETGAFEMAVISALPEHGVMLTLDRTQTRALLDVCQHVFESPEPRIKMGQVPSTLWANTGFHFMGQLPNRPELFWFCFGPLDFYLPTDRVRAHFHDLRAILHLLKDPNPIDPQLPH